MRTLTSIFCGLLIPLMAFLPGLATVSHAVTVVVGQPVVPAGPSYLIKQNFDTTSPDYDNGETWTAAGTGTVSPNVTTNPIVGATEYLNITNSAQTGHVWAAFTAQTEIHGFFRLRINSWAASTQNLLTIRTSGASVRGTISLTSGRNLRVQASGGTANTSTDAIATGVGNEVYVWFHCAMGSGSNAVMEAGWSTTSTKPGSYTASGAKTCSSTDGTGTGTILARVYPGNDSSNTMNCDFDRILIDDAVIGDNP